MSGSLKLIPSFCLRFRPVLDHEQIVEVSRQLQRLPFGREAGPSYDERNSVYQGSKLLTGASFPKSATARATSSTPSEPYVLPTRLLQKAFRCCYRVAGTSYCAHKHGNVKRPSSAREEGFRILHVALKLNGQLNGQLQSAFQAGQRFHKRSLALRRLVCALRHLEQNLPLAACF